MRLSVLRLLLPILLLLAWEAVPAAQSSSQRPSDSAGQAQQAQSNQSKDKNKEKGKGSQDDLSTEVFSPVEASNILNKLRDGLEGHTPRLVLSAFDADKMGAYPEFENQIQAFFNRYESFRVYFRIVQSAAEGPKGVVLVDIQLEAIPPGAISPPVRKNGQVRFALERGRKGWKIVDFNPRNFFS